MYALQRFPRPRSPFERFLLLIVALGLSFALFACANTPTATFNDKAAMTMRSVTAARETSTVLLQGGKITSAQHLQTEQRLDAVAAGVKTAREQFNANPSAGLVKIEDERAKASDIETKLNATKGTK